MNNDLISRSELKEAIRKRLGISSLKYLTEQEKVVVEEIDNAPTVSEITKEKLSIAYDQGYEDGKNNWLQEERPQGDLISRSKLKKVINDFYDSHFIGVVPNELITYANAVDTAIDIAPTVDLKDIYQEGHYDGHLEGYTKAINERKPQGEWKIIEHETLYLMGIYQCNLCSYKYACPDEFVRNFCPNCGADMRGKEE